jgi:hypothetical protein
VHKREAWREKSSSGMKMAGGKREILNELDLNQTSLSAHPCLILSFLDILTF